MSQKVRSLKTIFITKCDPFLFSCSSKIRESLYNFDLLLRSWALWVSALRRLANLLSALDKSLDPGTPAFPIIGVLKPELIIDEYADLSDVNDVDRAGLNCFSDLITWHDYLKSPESIGGLGGVQIGSGSTLVGVSYGRPQWTSASELCDKLCVIFCVSASRAISVELRSSRPESPILAWSLSIGSEEFKSSSFDSFDGSVSEAPFGVFRPGSENGVCTSMISCCKFFTWQLQHSLGLLDSSRSLTVSRYFCSSSWNSAIICACDRCDSSKAFRFSSASCAFSCLTRWASTSWVRSLVICSCCSKHSLVFLDSSCLKYASRLLQKKQC